MQATSYMGRASCVLRQVCYIWFHTLCQDINNLTCSRFQSNSDEWFCTFCKLTITRKQITHNKTGRMKIGSLNCRRKNQRRIVTLRKWHCWRQESVQTGDSGTAGNLLAKWRARDYTQSRWKRRCTICNISLLLIAEEWKGQSWNCFSCKRGNTWLSWLSLTRSICTMRTRANNNCTIISINAYAATQPL